MEITFREFKRGKSLSLVGLGVAFILFSGVQRPSRGVEVQARVQIWEKLSTRASDPKYYPLAEEERLEAWIPYRKGASFVKRRYEASGVIALVSFYQVVPERGLPYIATQIRLEHANRGLIAECSRYDGLNSPDIGIGSCSGKLGTRQVGVSLLKDSTIP